MPLLSNAPDHAASPRDLDLELSPTSRLPWLTASRHTAPPAIATRTTVGWAILSSDFNLANMSVHRKSCRTSQSGTDPFGTDHGGSHRGAILLGGLVSSCIPPVSSPGLISHQATKAPSQRSAFSRNFAPVCQNLGKRAQQSRQACRGQAPAERGPPTAALSLPAMPNGFLDVENAILSEGTCPDHACSPD